MTETGLDAAGLCGSFPLGYDHPLLDIFLPAMTFGMLINVVYGKRALG